LIVDKEEVLRRIRAALSEMHAVDNLHGITVENLPSFLVDPHEVRVDPDDGAPDFAKRSMWVVLEERPGTRDGYVVVFDPADASWGVAERTAADGWILVISADSFEGALNSM
jgi:hypothetical protein